MKRTIKHITVRANGSVFDVTYTSNWFEIISQQENPRRWYACQRLINAGVWSRFGGGRGLDYVLTPAPKVVYVPTLAESFAMAAVEGFKQLDPSSVSSFESEAAYYENLALNPNTLRKREPTYYMGNIRRAILYRFYARSLIKGSANYDEILAAYEGLEL